MWHEGQVTSIRRAKASNSLRTTVRVKRIEFRRFAYIINILQCHQLFRLQLANELLVAECKATFAVSHPTAKNQILHTSEHDGAIAWYLHGGPTTLKPLRFVMEQGHVGICAHLALCTANKSYKCHQLATIANAQGEHILTTLESLKLR